MPRNICVKIGTNPERKKLVVLNDGQDTSRFDLTALREIIFKMLKVDPKLLSHAGGSNSTGQEDLILYSDHPTFGEMEVEEDFCVPDLSTLSLKVQKDELSQGMQNFFYSILLMI